MTISDTAQRVLDFLLDIECDGPYIGGRDISSFVHFDPTDALAELLALGMIDSTPWFDGDTAYSVTVLGGGSVDREGDDPRFLH